MKASLHQQTPQPLSWPYLLLPPIIFLLLSLTAYYPSLHYQFQFDDLANITKHFAIRNSTLAQLLFHGTRWITFWCNSINYAWDRFNPFYYRLFNVLLHTSTSIILFYFMLYALRGLKKASFVRQHAYYLACLTAGLFLLHPVQTQTVSYVIQGRLEGFACFFIIIMAFCFIRMYQATHPGARAVYGIILITATLLSTGSKEIAIVGPALLLLVDWFFIAQGNLASLMQRWYVHAILWTLVGGIYLYFLKPRFFCDAFGLQMSAKNSFGNIITQHPHETIEPLHYFISEFKVIIHYLWIFIWPFHLCVEYDWKMVTSFFAPDCFFPFLALVGIAYVIYRLLKHDRAHPLAFGLLWFFIAIAPRSTIIPSPEFIVDYKTYIASPGWLLVLASGLVLIGTTLSSRFQRAHLHEDARWHIPYASALAMALLAILCGLGTQRRNKVWSSGTAFWGNIIANAPTKARAYNNYGVALAEQNKYQESIPYFQKAIALDQRYADPLSNLAVALRSTGHLDQAIVALKRAIQIQPNYPEAYNNLASFLMDKKEYAQADYALDLALRLRPTYGKAMYNKGKIQYAQQHFEKAHEWFKKACLEADFDNVNGFTYYAALSMQLKKYDEAVNAYQQILRLEPNAFDAAFQLANALYLTQRYKEAYQWYSQLAQKSPHDARLLHNLAETLWKLNRAEEALPYFEKAMRAANPPNPQIVFQYAACAEALGKLDKAREIIEYGLKLPLSREWQTKMNNAHAHLHYKIKTLNKRE